MAQGKALREIVSGASSDGREAYFEMVGVPIKDEHGRVTGGFEIIRDITELKATIEKLNPPAGSSKSSDMRAIQGEMNQPLAGISGYSEDVCRSFFSQEWIYHRVKSETDSCRLSVSSL